MSRILTERQQAILDFIAATVRKEGNAPSYREIANHFGITVGGLQKQLQALEDKGVLRRSDVGAARSIKVFARHETPGNTPLPILGQVRAGRPVEAIENIEDHLVVDPTLAKGAEYALRAKGDSMAPEILEDDLLLVRRASDANSGATVVAHVGDGDATVKRLRKTNSEAWLEAANPNYPPIRKAFRIVGRVVGLMRKI
ncbi:MAG TPA: transcriptional repressor LexA [Terriglobia bacterium]|nr:transcriptional repressor LexA [Terriglobia bacterium]